MNTVLLLCILQLTAGLPLVAGVGPWCFQCHNLFHPAGCMQITACGDNEACYTEKHSVNGVSQFSSGCKPIADCSKVVKRSTTVECVECCTGSACNEALCGADLFSNKTRKWCADCTKQTDPAACDHVKLCPPGDSCTVKKISLFGRTIYDLDCEKPAACQGKTLAGNNQMCCDEHLCNTNLAGSSPDTYTTTPSPAAATADINETSIAYVSHHDPNDTLTITCLVTGYPTPNVTWFFIPDANSTNVTGTTPTTTITGNSVTTTPAGSTSVGGQSATTTTPVGGATAGGGSTVASSTVAATTTGSTGGSTAAVVSSTSGGTSAGTAVTTTTASSTGTSPGQRTEITSGVTTSNGVSTLVITVPDQTDAGQYVCHVDNGQATDESNVTVTYSAAPLIQGPKNETVDNDVRDDVILDCQAEGAPTPQVLWILPPDAGGAEHLANGSLLLHNVHGDNTGQYTCIAKNSVGQDAKTFDLNVNDNSTAACRGMGTTLTTTSLLTTLSMPTTTAATSSTASSSSSSSSSTTAATQASITTTPFVCPTLPSTTTATTAATSSTPPSTTATTSPPTTPTTTPTTTTPTTTTTTTTVTTPTTASTSTTATTTTTPSPTTPPPTTTTTSTTTTTTTTATSTTTTPKTTIKKSTTPQTTTTTTTQVVPSTSSPPSITAVGPLWHDSDKGMAVLQCNAHARPGMTSVPPITWSRLEENYNHSDTKTYTENGHGVLVIMPHDQSAAPSGVYQCHVFGGSDNDTAEFAVYKEIPGPIDCRQSFDVGTPAPGTVLRTTCGKCQSGPVRSSHLIWRDQICHSAAGRGLIPQTGGVVAWMLKKNNEVALLKEENGHVKLIT